MSAAISWDNKMEWAKCDIWLALQNPVIIKHPVSDQIEFDQMFISFVQIITF